MHSSIFDLLGGESDSGIFGFGGGLGGHRRQRKAGHTAHPLNVTLEDLYKGKTTKLQVTRKILCKTCDG